MGRRIAISDIHGCARTFNKLIHEVLALSTEDTLYLLGDYINKGPDSKGVIDLIWELEKTGFTVHCLRGNHEQYLLDALADDGQEAYFLARGGIETLQSFGGTGIRKLPEEYLNFITSLPFHIYLDKYLLIHAGLNFESTDPFTDYDAMLNIRSMNVDPSITGGRDIIHGHVPTSISEISASLSLKNHHLSIDGGCVYKHIPGLSHLTALDIDSKKLYIQKNID